MNNRETFQLFSSLLNECVDKIANWFANDEYNVVFEAVTRENKIDIESDKGPVCVDGYPLGFGKLSGQMLKNKYLPGWRWQSS